MPVDYPSGGPGRLPADFQASTLQLLDQQFAFSQTGLLTASQFLDEARKRGVRLNRSELEQLHRRRILVPLYRIHVRPVSEPKVGAPSQQTAGTAWEIYSARSRGCLSDPARRRYTVWPRRTRRTAGVYYSRFQLLALRSGARSAVKCR